MTASSYAPGWKPRPVPTAPLVIGYAHNTEKVVKAIQNGVNVICWSFVDMVDKNNKPAFSTDLDLTKIQEIRQSFPNIVHVAAIGGWNGPHPPPTAVGTGREWCDTFVRFNQQNDYIFDGIDWDLEGHDDRTSPTSTFTLHVLDVMADFSRHAKHVYNMSVSMAPAESYLDAVECRNDGDESCTFSLQLNLPPLAWSTNQADREVVGSVGFQHAGRQCYAYVRHKAGIESFDWVSIQLYEAYSRYLHETARRNVPPTETLLKRADLYKNGYKVFQVPHYGDITVQVPLEKLVFGIANGWADGKKFVSVHVKDLASVQSTLQAKYKNHGFRGVMFWTIDEEGTNDMFLSSTLSRALNDKQEIVVPETEL